MRTTDGVLQTANLFFPRWTNFTCVLHHTITRAAWRVPLIARQCTISPRRRGQLCRPIWPPRRRASASAERRGGSPCQLWSIFKTISVIWRRRTRPRRRRKRREGGRGHLSPSLSDFSFPHSLFRPPLGLPVVDFPPQWPVLDLVKLVSEMTKRDKEKPAAIENGLMSF